MSQPRQYLFRVNGKVSPRTHVPGVIHSLRGDEFIIFGEKVPDVLETLFTDGNHEKYDDDTEFCMSVETSEGRWRHVGIFSKAELRAQLSTYAEL